MEGFTVSMLIILVVAFVIRYVQYYRNKLLEEKLTGIDSLPIVGEVFNLIKGVLTIVDLGVKLVTANNPELFCLCMGEYITDPNDIEIVLTSQKCLKKASIFYDILIPFVGEGLATDRNVYRWKKHRKQIAPSFSQKNIAGFFDLFSTNANKLVEILRKNEDKGLFDVYHSITETTLSTICETSIGVDINSNTANNYAAVIPIVDRALEVIAVRLTTLLYMFESTYSLFPHKHQFRSTADTYHSLMGTIITASQKYFSYKKKEVETKDLSVRKQKYFLEDLITLSEEDSSFTNTEVQDHINTMVFAGYETSASTIGFTLLVLAIYPEIQQKVYQEFLDVVGTDRPIEYDDLKNLQYLECVIKEALRLFPVAPAIARTTEEDLVLSTKTVSAGSTIILGILNVQTNPKFWPNPKKCDPDRFIPEEVSKRHPYSWVPFSAGPRNCVGIRYAWLSMKLVLTAIIKEYRLTSCYKDVESVPVKLGVVIKPANGFLIEITRRNT